MSNASMPVRAWSGLPEADKIAVVRVACHELVAEGKLVRCEPDVFQLASGFAEQALSAYHGRWVLARRPTTLTPAPLSSEQVADLIQRARAAQQQRRTTEAPMAKLNAAERGSRYKHHCTVAAPLYEEEKQLIEEAAAERGMSVATWLRLAALAFVERGLVIDLMAAAVRKNQAFSSDDDTDQDEATEAGESAAFAFAESLSGAEYERLLGIGAALPPRMRKRTASKIGLGGSVESDAPPTSAAPYVVTVDGVRVGCDTSGEALALVDAAADRKRAP
jgi:hypothetical protein